MDKNKVIKKIEEIELMLKGLKEDLGSKEPINDNPVSSAGQSEDKYSGPKGGSLLLIREGFFKSKQTLDAVKEALEVKGYNYHKDVVRNALNRLSVINGPLVTFREGKTKFYVERK